MLSKILKRWLVSMANALFYCKRKVRSVERCLRIRMHPTTTTSGEQTHEVVVKSKEHQAYQYHQPHLVSNLPFAHAERPALHDLDYEKEQVTTIKDRNRKKIQNSQTYADGSGQKDDITPTIVGLSVNFLRNTERACEAFRNRDGTGDDLSEACERQLRYPPSPNAAANERRKRIGTLQDEITRTQFHTNTPFVSLLNLARGYEKTLLLPISGNLHGKACYPCFPRFVA